MRALFAYIDPGAGATLMQLVLAGTVGISAIIKLKWHAIRGLFSRSENAETLSTDSLVQPSDEDDEQLTR